MIDRLHHMGERCRRAAHSARLLTRVLFVAFRGLYRSWLAQQPTVDPAFRKHSYAAYRRLWIKLESVYWNLRESNTDALTRRALLRDVTTFLADNFVYVREGDGALLTRYIESLHRLTEAGVRVDENDVAVAWDSNGGPAPNMFATTDGVSQEAVDLRNRVLQKLRHTLSAN